MLAPSPLPAQLGARIRIARRAQGMTQDDLARTVGVTRSAVAQWETGRAGQLGGNLARVARALATSAEYLLSGEARADQSNPTVATDELSLLRAYRDCSSEDRALLLRTAVRLARAGIKVPSPELDNNSVT